MRMALTRRQREIYDFIRDFVAENGYSPSLEEIGAHFGLASVATVHKHVHHLVEKGFLRKSWNRSRSVEPVPEHDKVADSMRSAPLLGTVAEGIGPKLQARRLEHSPVPSIDWRTLERYWTLTTAVVTTPRLAA